MPVIKGKFVIRPHTLIPGSAEGFFYVVITTSNTTAFMNKDGFAVEQVKDAKPFSSSSEAYDFAVEHDYAEDRG